MRFVRHMRARRREVTSRRISAAQRAVQRDRDSVALFPELARETNARARIDRIDSDGVKMVQRWRDFEAATWRRARRKLRSLEPDLQKAILLDWQRAFCPGTASYFADMVHCAIVAQVIAR